MYTDCYGSGQETSGTLLDLSPFGVIVSITGAKTVISWERLVLVELVKDGCPEHAQAAGDLMEGWIPHGRETPCNDGNPMQRHERRNREQGYRIQVSPQAAAFVGDLRPHSKHAATLSPKADKA
jgi:hypothetical protein